MKIKKLLNIGHGLHLTEMLLQNDKDIKDKLSKDKADLDYVNKELDKKVNKVEGKSLSTNDYTTEEKEKLLALEKYNDSEIKQRVSDIEADYAKSSDVPTKVSQLINDNKYQTEYDIATTLLSYAKNDDVMAEITAEIAKIIGDAPESFDTLKELSDWIASHEDDATAMNSAIKDNKINIEKKLDINQGAENSGKIAGINEKGDIIPMIPQGMTYNEETQCLEYGADENLKLVPGIGLDDTLAKIGYAADAAKVGEKAKELADKLEDNGIQINELKGDLANVTDATKNIFNDKHLSMASDWKKDSYGVWYGTQSALHNAFNTTKYPFESNFEENTQYTVSLYSKIDASASTSGNGLQIIFKYTDDTLSYPINVPNITDEYTYFKGTSTKNKTLKEVHLTYWGGGANVAYIKNVQFEKGVTATEYEPHFTAKDSFARGEIVAVKNEIEKIKTNELQLDFNNPDGKYINKLGSWISVSSSFSHSNPVYVSRGTVIRVDNSKCTSYNDLIAICAFFKTGDDVTSQKPYGTVSYTKIGTYDITVPDGYEYVVFNKNVNGAGINIGQPRVFLGESYISDSLSRTNQKIDMVGFDNVSVNLPEFYDLVIGDSFELFWRGVIKTINPFNYNIYCDCSVGHCYSKKFEFTPTSTGNYPLTVTVKDSSGKILDSKSTTLRVNAKATSPSSEKNVLCVGDSLLNNGQWAIESHRRLTDNGGNPNGLGLTNINFVGTCVKDGVGYEGIGGFSFKRYNEYGSNDFVWITCQHDKTLADQHSTYADTNGVQWKIETLGEGRLKMIRVSQSGTMPSSGTLTYVSGGTHTNPIVFSSSAVASENPFWNTANNSVDFSNYANNVLGINSIDYLYVLLGWNSMGYSEEGYKTQIRTFIDNVLSAFPNCKIALMGVQIPSVDGCGVSYGCSWNWYEKACNVFDFNDWYTDISNEYENVHFVNVSGQFDTDNNMPAEMRPVNVRSDKTELFQVNGVHPALSGYNQIADVVYRDLTHMLLN